MTTFLTLTEDEFVARFRPMPNHLNPGNGFDFGDGCCLFETFGAEFAHIAAFESARIWTVIDGDGGLAITSGAHFVNRLGYLLTEIPCPPDTLIEVELEDNSEPDDEAGP